MPNVPANVLIEDNNSFGIDRNGQTFGKAGTPNLPGQLILSSQADVDDIDGIPIEEFDDSPTFERAEQMTVTHNQRLSYLEGLIRMSVYGRGGLVDDAGGNLYRLLSTSLQYQKGSRSILKTIAESISFDVPPDEFQMNPTRLGLDIMKHPRYFYSLMPTNQIPNYTGPDDTPQQIGAKQAIIRAIQAYRENPFIPTSANINSMTGLLHDQIVCNLASGQFTYTIPNPLFIVSLADTGLLPLGVAIGSNNPSMIITTFSASNDPNNKVAMALAAAKEIIGKLWRMEDTPLVNGIELTWAEYYFRPPWFNLGGYIEDPTLATPSLPDYFYSTDYPPDALDTVWDELSYYNPQCFSVNGRSGGGTSISWLRDADTCEFQRTWFRVTRKWLGAPIGAWDAQFYTQGPRPSVPTDYVNLILQ
jgi:hypothetical protein